jgi:hypothetical protein
MEQCKKQDSTIESATEESVNRILIGVTGGSASGKTTLC